MKSSGGRTWAVRMAAWLAAGCVAAVAGASRPDDGLKPVDPGLADVGPFGMSFRQMQRDLRKPMGFDRVYQVPAAPGKGGAGGGGGAARTRFARVSGGLAAVFPRSTYVPVKEGMLVTVPPDTRFVVGDPGALQAAGAATVAPSRTAAGHAVNSGAAEPAARAADRSAGRPVRDAAAPAAAKPAEGMLTSEAYRVHRIAELLTVAGGG